MFFFSCYYPDCFYYCRRFQLALLLSFLQLLSWKRMVLVKPQKFSYNCQVCCHNLFISIFHSFFLQHPFSRTLLYESFFRLLTMFLFFKTFISSLVNIFLTWGDFSLFANRKSPSQRTKLIHTPQTKKLCLYYFQKILSNNSYRKIGVIFPGSVPILSNDKYKRV